jgi:hypothetical protein
MSHRARDVLSRHSLPVFVQSHTQEVTMFDDQTVELLPTRITMGRWGGTRGGRGGDAVVANGNGNGNTEQGGLINVSLLNGNGNGNGNGTIAVGGNGGNANSGLVVGGPVA